MHSGAAASTLRPMKKLYWVTLAAVVCGCSSVPPRLSHSVVQSPVMDKEMAYAVWAPIDLDATERLPLVVFLHGGGDSEESFDEFEIGQHLDQELAAGRIPRTVIVLPRGEFGFWENWKDGSRRYRDWVIQEVVPAVQKKYHTLECPEACHVAGVSMGGHGTMRFAYHHPDLFASAAALSAPQLSVEGVQEFADTWWVSLFVAVDRIWGDVSDAETVAAENVYVQWQKQEDLKGVRLLIAWAEDDRDGIIESNKAFHQHLVDQKIEHEAFEFAGNHGWRSWTPVIDQVLRFAVWGASDAEPPAVEPVPATATATSATSASIDTLRSGRR